MTDAEIIRALECCGIHETNCTSCPYFEKTYCVDADALKLINRQKAEIERLQKDGLVLNKTFMDFVNQQKAEAIKEFAGMLKARIREYIFISELEFQCEEVDNLVKELTE